MTSPKEEPPKTKEELGLARERVLVCGETTVVVLPSDGAMLARFRVGETDVFLPDQKLIVGGKGKRRGGMPFLFPNAGPLTEPSKYSLPQHGFGRKMPWTVETCEEGKISLLLRANEETQRQFPFDFEAKYSMEAGDSLLKCQIAVANQSDKPMPIAPGLHPYFLVPVDRKLDIRTNIPDFNPRDYDFVNPVVFPGQETVELEVPDWGIAVIKPSPEFGKLVVWSEIEKGGHYVCIEPWVGDVNAILHPQERLNIPPGEEVNLSVEIQFHPE